MRLLILIAALVVLAGVTFFVAGINVIAACAVGGIGFSAIVTWVAIGGSS